MASGWPPTRSACPCDCSSTTVPRPRWRTRHRGVVINPVLETSEIPETMPDPDDDEEGCLSVPGESFPTGRAGWARVTGLDADGKGDAGG